MFLPFFSFLQDSQEPLSAEELLCWVGVPTLAELGVDEEDLGDCLYPGGESAALDRMDQKVTIAWSLLKRQI